MTDRLLSRREVADLLGVPEKTLSTWAYKRDGPPYYVVGKHARYRTDDLDRWLEARRVEGRA